MWADGACRRLRMSLSMDGAARGFDEMELMLSPSTDERRVSVALDKLSLEAAAGEAVQGGAMARSAEGVSAPLNAER
jgi:hypothetical protein